MSQSKTVHKLLRTNIMNGKPIIDTGFTGSNYLAKVVIYLETNS